VTFALKISGHDCFGIRQRVFLKKKKKDFAMAYSGVGRV
jgi:hypothetical protein